MRTGSGCTAVFTFKLNGFGREVAVDDSKCGAARVLKEFMARLSSQYEVHLLLQLLLLLLFSARARACE